MKARQDIWGADSERQRWVGSWAAAQQSTEPENLPPAPGLSSTTLRQIVRLTLGGELLRVRFSNTFGIVPLTIGESSLAHVDDSRGDGAIRPDSCRSLMFSGAASVTIPPGASALSEPVRFSAAPLSDIAVTVFVEDQSPAITGHPGARCAAYLARGNQVGAQTLLGASVENHWYYLSGVHISPDTDRSAAAVAILGDSITDGRGSTTGENRRWPDFLARRLQSRPSTAHVGVLNLGIGGNRVCADGLGPSAISRIERDILQESGVRYVILVEGINDLGTGSGNAQDLIAAYNHSIDRVRERGMQVYGGTLTPCGGSFYFNEELEAERQAVNSWIRASGRFDAVIDFDAALKDPENTDCLRPETDCGDHLHLNDAGYECMARAVDLMLFERQSRPRTVIASKI